MENKIVELEKETIRAMQAQSDWMTRGEALHRANCAHKWPLRGQNTFGRFLQRCAKALELHESMLWRDLSAFRYIDTTLFPRLTAAGAKAQDLESLSSKVSSEHIVILERIERVAPTPDFIRTAQQVIKGDITRSALRVYWDSLKPALEGKSARGANEKPVAQGPVIEEMIRGALSKAAPSWMGVKNPFSFDVFVGDEMLELDMPGDAPYRPDLVIALQETERSKPTFHAITVQKAIQKRPASNFLAAINGFDSTWIAIPELYDFLSNNDAYSLPLTVGVLRVCNDDIEVVRRPALNANNANSSYIPNAVFQHTGTRVGEIACAIVSKRLRRF